MEDAILIFYTTLSLTFLLFVFSLLLKTIKSRRINLPPTPPSFPIIGHLHLLKHPLHRTLHKLSQKYGPIFSLRLGSQLVFVVSTRSAVEECFTKNDIVLANRPRLIAGKHLGYGYTTMVTSPYGDHWRNLRRIGTIEIFSSNRLNRFSTVRSNEVKRLLHKLSENSLQEFSKVELKSMFSSMTYNNMMRMVVGKRYYGDDVANEKEARQFRELMKEVLAIGGVANPGDFLPVLNWIGPNGYEKRVVRLAKRMDAFLQGLIDEQKGKSEEASSTMINHLLSLQESQPDYYSDKIIKGIIVVMLLAGTETSAVTLEWAMCNLLNNPDVLRKAKDELDLQIGQERLINEDDVSRLPYLQGIVLETLRLTAPTPLLVPHFSSDNCKVGGYDLPRGTIVLINAWAIHTDPNLWAEPMSFKPERHGNEEGNYNQKFMPFGLGRRACPGAGLAQRIVSLCLGSLIQCFEWTKVSEKEIDMREGRGVTVSKAVPLEACCKARLIMNKVLAESLDGV